MTILEAYERSYAKKNKAIKTQLAEKKRSLYEKQRRAQEAGEDQLREAYATYMRASAIKKQQSRAAGVQGGAEENAVAGTGTKHAAAQDTRVRKLAVKAAEFDDQIKLAEQNAARDLQENERALQLRRESEAAKQQAAEQKTAARQSKSSSRSSTKKKSKQKQKEEPTAAQKIIERMQNGEYSEDFAFVLNWPDEVVRSYVQMFRKAAEDNEAAKKNRLPGTYKPPLH